MYFIPSKLFQPLDYDDVVVGRKVFNDGYVADVVVRRR